MSDKQFSFGDYECKECGHLIDEDDDEILYNKDKVFIGFVCNACGNRQIIVKMKCDHEVTTAEHPNIVGFCWDEATIEFDEICEKCGQIVEKHRATWKREI